MSKNRQILQGSSQDWLVLVLVSFMVFGLSWFLERRLERYAERQIDAAVEKLTKRLGIPVQIGSREIQLGSLRLIDIAVGDGQPIIIDRVEIGLSFNPFSPSFLRPGRVDLGRVYIKEQVSRDGRIAWIAKWRDILRRKGGAEPSKASDSKWIPPEIHIGAAKIILANGADEHTVATGLSATMQIPQRRLFWEAEMVVVKPWIDEDFLSGRLDYSDVSELQWMIRRRPKWLGSPEWSASCERKKAVDEIVCDVDASHLPRSIVRRFESLLDGKSEPGFHGSVRASKLANGQIKASVDADINGIVIRHKGISIDPIGPFSVGNQFSLLIDPRTKHIEGKQMKFAFAPDVTNERSVGVWLDVELNKSEGQSLAGLTGDIHLMLPRSRCDDVLNAVPPGFAPGLQGFSLNGDISLEANVKLSHGDIDFKWGKTLMECRVAKVPQSYTKEYLSGAFELERTTNDGSIVRIPVDPARTDYTQLKDIPAVVVSAFVTSEDAGFWQHHGVEPSAIVQAIERNAREGRAAVGASTITMQTVKNLFLSRDKNISRKAQEIFLAWHLDQSIGKQRILEIYLNIVEFGPGLYGIGAASEKFFGVKPSQLTLKQAIYLASLLPAPIPRFLYFCRGAMTENYTQLINTLLQRMVSLGRISSEAYGAAMSEPIVFQDAQSEGRCKRNSAVSESTPSEDNVTE